MDANMNNENDYNNTEIYLKISKMSLLLGTAYSSIANIVNTSDEQKHYKCVELMQKLGKGIDDIVLGKAGMNNEKLIELCDKLETLEMKLIDVKLELYEFRRQIMRELKDE